MIRLIKEITTESCSNFAHKPDNFPNKKPMSVHFIHFSQVMSFRIRNLQAYQPIRLQKRIILSDSPCIQGQWAFEGMVNGEKMYQVS
jgi:hypothetical protein